MASAVAALKKALLVAVCVMLLLHSSMGQQPPTTSPASTPPYTGQQPPPPSPPPVVPAPTPTPTPTPVPAPMPTPTPASPAPSPISNCTYSDCASQCTPSCEAGYHPSNCTSLAEGVFNGCYESCTNHTCPGKSCVHSGCGVGTCSCDNPHAVSCCESCRNAVYPAVGSAVQRCQSYNERCSKNCTQQGA
ncbi:unnamed protein product [Miscanthus lutarioriparius]|uniref:Uncharacterized protein n=1 Tax=Miscanthus lutarioriparius TaxID=422564 RepID=A0A811RLQ4_9POAL|nr:unnamed protein product [Miscanthus lutarioriparius]